MTPPHYDALILGGGTAGCVLAGRLSENPDYSVCLIEAGPDYGYFSADRWPADILDARWLALSHSWDREHDDPWQLRARILGGCSAHNLCVVLEGTPEDYDEWGAGWSYAEFAPYLQRARETLRTSLPPTEALSPWHRAFFDAGGADAIAHPVNMVGTVRWNAAFAYIDPARERQNLTILDRTFVDRILLDGPRAFGALTSAGEIHADTVVVTSGAYGSPGILLRSQIGPASGLPVGEGLRDHVGVGLEFQATANLQREMNAFAARSPLFMGQVTLRARSRSCPEGMHDLFIFPALDAEHSISVAVVAVKPRSTGTVRLNEGDPESPLAIDHGLLSEPADIATLADGVDILRRLIATAPISQYVVRETVPGEHVRSRLYATVAARGFYHPVGTCAIGAVVDSDGAVFGFEGLIVADASIIPTIPRANTNLTVAAIAERIAVLIQEDQLSHA